MRFKFIYLLLLGCLFTVPLRGQVNFLGKPGYMTTPTAAWEEDRQLGLSIGYLPNEYSIFQSEVGLNNTNFYNARVGLTSFMEVNLSIAHRPSMAEQVGVGDRQFDFRFRLLNERTYFPALVLGWTPPGTINPIMGHDYLVATKNFHTSIGKFRLSGGYGSPYVIIKNAGEADFFKALKWERKSNLFSRPYLSGFFGSLAYSPVDFGGVVVEYNSETINAGAYITLWEWLHLQGYSFEGKAFAFQVAAHFRLDFLPRSLRRHERSLE